MSVTAPPAEQRVQLQFDDNSLLPVLFGEHDRNLARIEQHLGIDIVARGNQLALSGSEGAVSAAKAALELLYDKARRGITIDQGEVDAAVRLALMASAGELRNGSGEEPDLFGLEAMAIRTKRRGIAPRSARQGQYIQCIQNNELTFGLGPAGTGKTYLAVAAAVSMLAAGQVERLVLSRPAVEAGERLGFLPGDLKEKVDPYLRPLYDALHDMLPMDQVMRQLGSGAIEVAPLAFMRGRTLSHAFVILDEAQNTTSMQMKMFLTRLGEGSRMVVTGDPSQVDLPPGQKSGLIEARRVLRNVQGIGFVEFTDRDVVRHPLVSRIVRAYDAAASGGGERPAQ